MISEQDFFVPILIVMGLAQPLHYLGCMERL
jgi:hypothetical protein